MYISVDMTTLKVLCKHPNFMRCWDYSIITVGDNFQVFPVDDRRCWASFTDLEIQMLYINMTGNSAGILFNNEHICNVFIQYIMEAEETKIFDCVHKQAQWCVENDKFGYKYVVKADVPVKGNVIWPEFGYNKQLEERVQMGVDPGTWKEQVGPAWQPPRSSESSTSTPRTRATQPREKAGGSAGVQGSERPARNGACARIWEVADELWNADPRPDLIKQIKKDAKIALVAEGINPSTCSVQLSKWEKEKGLN